MSEACHSLGPGLDLPSYLKALDDLTLLSYWEDHDLPFSGCPITNRIIIYSPLLMHNFPDGLSSSLLSIIDTISLNLIELFKVRSISVKGYLSTHLILYDKTKDSEICIPIDRRYLKDEYRITDHSL